MKFEVADEAQLQHYKDRAMMLKMLCLDQMGKNVMADVSSFSKRDKVKLQVEIEKHWDDDDIVQKFNELCIETIFEDGKMNPEKLPVMETISPVEPEEQKEYRRKWKEDNEGVEGIIIKA
jgi:hypothetical protein